MAITQRGIERYWVVLNHGEPTGYVHAFYRADGERDRQMLEEKQSRIFGPFQTLEVAEIVLQEKLKESAKEKHGSH